MASWGSAALCSVSALCELLCAVFLLLPGLLAKEYCFYDKFQALCREDQVVVIQAAQYGRMEKGKCIKDNLGHMGCQSSVLETMDRLCSGRQECTTSTVGGLFKDLETCPVGLHAYVDITSYCVQVISPSASRCEMSTAATFAPPPPGFLANDITGRTACGNEHHPWIIEVSATQQISLTLHDFGTSEKDGDLSCKQYGTVRDHERNEDIPICGGRKRTEVIYVSHSNKVEISLMGPLQIQDTYFMIEYKAVGCIEPKYSSDMWMKVSKDHVTLGCYTSKSTWKLTCIDSTWQGQVGNCSKDVIPAHSPTNNETWPVFMAYSEGKATFLVAVVAVVITVAVLIVALLYTNRPSPPAVALGSLDEPYEAKDIAFFVSDPRTEGQKDPMIRQESAPSQQDHTLVMPRQSCASVPVSTSDSDTYASENATLPLRAMDMDEFESAVQPPLPSKVKQTHKPPAGDLPPPELPPKYPPKVGSGYRANDLTSYSRLNAPNSVDMQQAYKSLIKDSVNQSRPLPPVPLNSMQF